MHEVIEKYYSDKSFVQTAQILFNLMSVQSFFIIVIMQLNLTFLIGFQVFNIKHNKDLMFKEQKHDTNLIPAENVS